MLDQEKVKSNFNRFLDGLKSIEGLDVEKLIELYGIHLMTSPLTKSNETIGCYEGGLIENTLNVFDLMFKINKSLPEEKKVPVKSLTKVGLLFQIGMYNMFKKLDSKWHNDRGIMYEYNADKISMSVGERSVKMATELGVKFTDEEYQAILNERKVNDEQSLYFTEMLGELLRSSSKLVSKY